MELLVLNLHEEFRLLYPYLSMDIAKFFDRSSKKRDLTSSLTDGEGSKKLKERSLDFSLSLLL